MNLTQLEALVAVVDSGGISGAAKVMYMSQPSVSNHVRNLESGLGIQLLERTPQGAKPTHAGEVVVHHARRIFQQLSDLDHDVRSIRGVATGRLVVAGTTSLGTYVLPHLVARFAADVPNVNCELRVGNQDSVENWLLAGDVALGLCAELPHDEHLQAEPMFTESMMLVASADSPLAGRQLTPADLSTQRFLMREAGSATRRQQEAALHQWALDGVERWDLWGPESVKESVYAGLGVALLSEHVSARERATGRLVALAVDPPAPSRTVHLARKADRVLTAAEHAFTKLVRETTAWPGPRG